MVESTKIKVGKGQIFIAIYSENVSYLSAKIHIWD